MPLLASSGLAYAVSTVPNKTKKHLETCIFDTKKYDRYLTLRAAEM